MASLFQNANISPKRLWDFMQSIYGDEWVTWQDEALRDTLIRDGHGEVHPTVWPKLRALQVLRTSAMPYQDFHAFENVVLALNGITPHWGFIEGSDPEEQAYAITIIREIFPMAEFSEDVPAYIAANAADQGFVVLPPPIDFAQVELDKILKHTVAEGTSNEVLKEIEDIKNHHKLLDTETLPAQAAQKYLAVLAYVDSLRDK